MLNINLSLFYILLIILHNPGTGFSADSNSENPNSEGGGHYTVGPNYVVHPDLKDKGNAKGRSFEFMMQLDNSNIFRGTDVTLNSKKPVRKERKIYVYVPATYKNGTSAPVLVMHDGPSRLNLVTNRTSRSDCTRPHPRCSALGMINGRATASASRSGW